MCRKRSPHPWGSKQRDQRPAPRETAGRGFTSDAEQLGAPVAGCRQLRAALVPSSPVTGPWCASVFQASAPDAVQMQTTFSDEVASISPFGDQQTCSTQGASPGSAWSWLHARRRGVRGHPVRRWRALASLVTNRAIAPLRDAPRPETEALPRRPRTRKPCPSGSDGEQTTIA